MRCRECSHILWNQPAPADDAPRACSECGSAYTVESFAFTRGKVAFHCPRCEQPYFGTSALGHLEPVEFDCAKCGAHIGMESCVLRPHAGATDAEAMLSEPVPWTVEGTLWRRLVGTVRLGLTRADKVPAGLVRAPSAWRASVFLAIVVWIGMVPGLLLMAVFAVVMNLVATGSATGAPATAPMAVGFGGFGAPVLATVVQSLLAPVFAAGVIAFAALVVRSVGTTGSVPFVRVYESVCYASGALVLYAIPGCGGLVASILAVVNGAQAVSALMPQEARTLPVTAFVVAMLAGFAVQSCAGFGLSILFAGL